MVSASATHWPLYSVHAPPEIGVQSASAVQPRQLWLVRSHTGAVAAHCELAVHCGAESIARSATPRSVTPPSPTTVTQVGGARPKSQVWPSGHSPLGEHGTSLAAWGL